MTPDYTLSSLTQPSGPPPRRRRTGLVIALAATGALVLGGIAALITTLTLTDHGSTATASSRSGVETTPSARHSTPPNTYTDASQLVDWLSREGLPCSGSLEYIDGPVVATSMIDCGPTVVAAVYKDHRDAVRGFDVLVNLAKQKATPHVYMAIGENWTVSADDEAYVRQVTDRLGGEFRSF